MNLLEQKIVDILIDLKQNHHAIGVKAEFEDEGVSFEEAAVLKNIAKAAGLGMTVKIGGCSALNDIFQVKKIGVNAIVAPMIESSYALKKFIQGVNKIYEGASLKPKLFVNIETINGYKIFDEILSMAEFSELSGVVVGRFDLAKSLGLACKDIHSDQIFNIVNDLAIKFKNTGKIFTVGGGVRYESLEFFYKLPKNSMQRFETRKIIFDAKSVLETNDFKGILKAIEFEIMWIENKQNLGIPMSHFDSKRIEDLKLRFEKFAEKSFCVIK